MTRIQMRRGTAAAWTSANSVLASGEFGVETDTSKFKLGDGTTHWNSLPYEADAAGVAAADVAVETARAEAAELAERSNLLEITDAGGLTVAPGTLRFRFPAAVTIESVAITADTAPTGAALIVDINKNGTTIFTTQNNRPTIAISGNASTDAVPDVTAFAAGDYLTVDIDQIGSTIPGSDLVATVKYH